MSIKIEFAFNIGDEVVIADALDIKGRVVACDYDVLGIRYNVVWWQDGRRQSEWLNDWEIKPSGRG